MVAIPADALLGFSMRMGCPSEPFIRSARTRATVSVGLPAVYGTKTVMGRVG
jgi:hypothetical protein